MFTPKAPGTGVHQATYFDDQQLADHQYDLAEGP